MDYLPIPATAEAPVPNPPCSGHWRRAENGDLYPADEATAASAGLLPPVPADTTNPEA